MFMYRSKTVVGLIISKIMQKRVLSTNNLKVLFNHETIEILGNESVHSIKVLNNKSKEEKIIKAAGFFVAIGHKPNTGIFEHQNVINVSTSENPYERTNVH